MKRLDIELAAHTLTLTPKESYEVAKRRTFTADYNKDGVVDAGTEMTYAHAYYASGFDKGGKTYLETAHGPSWMVVKPLQALTEKTGMNVR